MKTMKWLALAAVLWAQWIAAAANARAEFKVSIASQTNANIRLYSGGTNYPIAPTTQTVGGVGFDLVPNGTDTDSLGVLQLDPNPGGTTSFTVNTSVFGATTVYTLMNSAFGTAGKNIASIEFVGTGGADATFDVIEGLNIRDHFNDGFNNSATNIVPNEYGGGADRLDRQTFLLPSLFATETLQQIIFSIGPDGDVPGNGEAFLAAVTVSDQRRTVTPEPSTFVMLATGLIAGCVFCRRRR
jgi:hypothetical protein